MFKHHDSLLRTDPRYLFKIALYGSGGVRKTSFFNRFISNTFRAEQLMTIGINYVTQYLDLPQGRVDLQIWDYGGLTIFSSFVELEEWHTILEEKLSKKIPILLVGCKVDLCDESPTEQLVPDKKIQRYVQGRKCIDFIKTSAKTGKNIRLCFEIIANALLGKSNVKI